MKLFNVNKVYNWKEFILLFSIIMISSQTVLFGTNSIHRYSTIVNLFAIAIATYLFFRGEMLKKGVKNHGSSYLLLITMCVMPLLSGFGNGGFSLEYIVWICLVIGAFYYTSLVSWNKFNQIYEDIMVIIAGSAIIIFLLSLFAPAIIERLPMITNTGGIHFYNAYIGVMPTFDVRLFGPFREPGVFQIFLNIALALTLFCREQISIWRVAILSITIILTMSTTGYIAMALLVIVFLISRGKFKGRGRGWSFAILFLIAGFFYLYLQTDLLSAEGDVFWKLSDTENDSTVSRLGAITANIQMFLENPLFGVGLSGVEDKYAGYVVAYWHYESSHNTNSVLINFAAFGFIYGVIFCVGFWKLCKMLSKGDSLRALMLFVFIVMILSGENVTRFILIFIFMFYGLKSTQKYYAIS